MCWLPVALQHTDPHHHAVPVSPVTLVSVTATRYVIPFVTFSAYTPCRIGPTSSSSCSPLRATWLCPYAAKEAATPTSRLSAVRISGSEHRLRDGSYRNLHLHWCAPAPCEVNHSSQVTLVEVDPVSWPYWLLDGYPSNLVPLDCWPPPDAGHDSPTPSNIAARCRKEN
jgi:hypothetical protein